MSGRIPREFIDDLLVRVDIVDLIDSHVPLKKSGSSYVARCPFHTEKSPSFSVNRNKQFYHCFGCGVGGNAISFLMDFSHLDFVEAIEDLAGFVGIDVPRDAVDFQRKSQDFSEIYSVLEKVAVFYVEQLRSHPESAQVVEYLKQRGVSGEIAKAFSLGYAPDEWDALSSRFDNKLLLDAGMLKSRDGGGAYDRFRGRLIFPIRDKRKRVIAFGGRVMDDSMPKYLNSPETAVFSKGKELYGLPELLDKNSKPERILIVEGYIDVLALAQAGVNYSVAALGTAASKVQMDMLFRFTSELVFCFDGDEAGRKAAWRALQECFGCLKDGRQVRVMLLPQGQDPDSLVKEEGLQAFERRIDGSQLLSDYFFENICGKLDLKTVEGRARLQVEVEPYLNKIPAGFFREMMFKELGAYIQQPVLDVLEIPATISKETKSTLVNSVVTESERVVLALLLQNPEMTDLVEEREVDWGVLSFRTKDALIDLLRAIDLNQPENTGRLLEIYREDDKKHGWLAGLAGKDVFLSEGVGFDVNEAFSGALERVIALGKKQFLDERLDELVENQQRKKD